MPATAPAAAQSPIVLAPRPAPATQPIVLSTPATSPAVAKTSSAHAPVVEPLQLDQIDPSTTRPASLATDPHADAHNQQMFGKYSDEADSLWADGKRPQSLAARQIAIGFLRQLARDNPRQPASQHDLAGGLLLMGQSQIQMKQVNEAIATYREAISLLEKYPGDKRPVAAELAAAWVQFGKLFETAAQPAQAMTCYSRATQILEPLKNTTWNDPGVLKDAYKNLAAAQLAAGKTAEARQSQAKYEKIDLQ
jgi:tetratricopeptide (TPR) repeat protein